MKKYLLPSYRIVISCLGLFLFWKMDYSGLEHQIDNLIILILLNIVFNLFAVQTSSGAHLSLSLPILFATQLIHGTGAAYIVNIFGIITHYIRFKKEIKTFLFNIGQLNISLFFAAGILKLAPVTSGKIVLFTENLPIIFLSLILLDLANHILVFIFISLKEGQNLFKLVTTNWINDVKRVIPLYYTAGIALATLYHIHGAFGEFLVAFPLVVAYFVLIDQQAIQLHKKESEIDPLTNCLNRRCLNEWVKSQLPEVLNRKEPLSTIMVDIDNFKKVNDTYGHLIGDKFLKKIAHTMRLNLRKTDMLFRFGGEEFLIMLPGTDRVHAMTIAERLRQNISEITVQSAEGEDITITVSMGISSLDYQENTEEDDLQYELVRRADNALYMAKKRGKNRVELYTS